MTLMNSATLEGHLYRVGDSISVKCIRSGGSSGWRKGTVRCIHDQGFNDFHICVELLTNNKGLIGCGCEGTWRIGNTGYKYPIKPGRPSGTTPLLDVLRKQTSING